MLSAEELDKEVRERHSFGKGVSAFYVGSFRIKNMYSMSFI